MRLLVNIYIYGKTKANCSSKQSKFGLIKVALIMFKETFSIT